MVRRGLCRDRGIVLRAFLRRPCGGLLQELFRYAAFRKRSALRGTITGIDPLRVNVWNRETEEMERQTMYCAIVIPYRVRIVIPAT